MSLEAGKFTMKAVTPLEFTKSPEKGTPCVKTMTQYMDGPNVNQQIEWVGWLTDASAARTGESLAHMGYDGSDPSSIMRLCFQGVTEYEQYERADGGQGERARLKWINGTSRLVTMSPAEEAAAKDRLKKAFTAAKFKVQTQNLGSESVKYDEKDEPNF